MYLCVFETETDQLGCAGCMCAYDLRAARVAWAGRVDGFHCVAVTHLYRLSGGFRLLENHDTVKLYRLVCMVNLLMCWMLATFALA
jgi:hypothetical protein